MIQFILNVFLFSSWEEIQGMIMGANCGLDDYNPQNSFFKSDVKTVLQLQTAAHGNVI